MDTEQSAGVSRVSGPEGLMLQEVIHRSSNDLQMVVGLLALQSQRAASAEARSTLTDAMQRVSVLAHARNDLGANRLPSLSMALQNVCTALQSQAEPRSILIALKVEREIEQLSPLQVTTIALVVNELATNAIKHAYEDSKEGYILVTQTNNDVGDAIILVDDDGLPFPDPVTPKRGGLGMEIADRMMKSIGGQFARPKCGSKTFELRVPYDQMRKRGTGEQSALAPADVKQNIMSMRASVVWALHVADAQGRTLIGALLADVLYLLDCGEHPPVES